MITNKQLVKYAEKALGSPYWYGTYGQISSKDLYYKKRKQYPNQYEWKLPESQLKRRVFDCVGLIKGALWSNADFTKNPKYKASEDVSANGMFERCKKHGKIKDIPEVAGVLVFKDGHVGIYIGGGYVIEAKGHKWGVIKSKLSERPFTHYGFCPYVEYVKEEKPAPKPVEKPVEAVYYPKCKSDFHSIVDALNSVGVNSSFSFRRKLAKVNGIVGYIGKAEQNIKLLNLLKKGKLKKVL